mgnify:CR=1 FL=1
MPEALPSSFALPPRLTADTALSVAESLRQLTADAQAHWVLDASAVEEITACGALLDARDAGIDVPVDAHLDALI